METNTFCSGLEPMAKALLEAFPKEAVQSIQRDGNTFSLFAFNRQFKAEVNEMDPLGIHGILTLSFPEGMPFQSWSFDLGDDEDAARVVTSLRNDRPFLFVWTPLGSMVFSPCPFPKK
jgi:hypothetical protein